VCLLFHSFHAIDVSIRLAISNSKSDERWIMLNHFDPAPRESDGWNADEASERWERLNEEQAEQGKLKEIAQQKEQMSYSDAIATEICERVASGELLTVICNDPHMPTPRRVISMMKEHSDFGALYNLALLDRLMIFEEQVIQFADALPKEPLRATASSNREKIQFVDPVQKAKLQIEVRMRHLKAGKPQKWGDQSTLMVKQDDPYDCAALSSEEIEEKIAAIERKELIMRQGPR
jgi:hypothetical protein